MESKQFLKLLSEETGLTGFESRVAAVAGKVFRELCDDVRLDKLGNCIGFKKGEGHEPRPKVMLAGHMDEVGLMVTKIESRGFVRFTAPGVDRRTIPAQEVVIHGERDVPGIVCVIPPHLLKQEDRSKSYKVEDLVIDTGLPEDDLKKIVSVGDPVTFARKFTELQGSVVAGKAFDDRAGVAVIYECLLNLKKMKHEADVYAVATVQEEVGYRGAQVATYGIAPDIGIAIDVGFGDQPGVAEDRQITLGKGPSLEVGPNVHPRIFEALKNIASDLGIPHQVTVVPGRSGTDAWAMQVSRWGVPTAIISIPNRNMHTSVEVLDMNDIKQAGRLLAEFIVRVDRAFVEGLIWS